MNAVWFGAITSTQPQLKAAHMMTQQLFSTWMSACCRITFNPFHLNIFVEIL
jgi:hypothetical protein